MSLAELGAFLGHYTRLIRLHPPAVAAKYMTLKGEEGEWPNDFPTAASFETFLKSSFYPGTIGVGERRQFQDLNRLLSAFTHPNEKTDLPRLMAEWLCARTHDGNSVGVTFGHGEPSVYGHKVRYKNATRRLKGMDCAIIEFEMEGNTPPPKMRDGNDLCRVTKLLREFGNNPDCEKVPHSHLHVHPGDEFVYVTEGCMYVQLDNTGLWTCLQAGDFLHFTAEIPHALWNVYPEPAKAIIVRFFQLNRQGTRDRQVELLEEIQELMRKFERPTPPASANWMNLIVELGEHLPRWMDDAKDLFGRWAEIAPWIYDRTRRPDDRLHAVDGNSPVKDHVGLSRFLLTHVAGLQTGDLDRLKLKAQERKSLEDFRDAIRALERERGAPSQDERQPETEHKNLANFQMCLTKFLGENFRNEVSRPILRSCFVGLPNVTDRTEKETDHKISLPNAATLNAIATFFKMPRVLLDGYLSPNALRVVAVRGANAEVGSTPLDWVTAPQDASNGTVRDGGYMLPARSLANSDMSIVLLNLTRDDEMTEWNKHPGFEAIIAVHGQARVEFDEAGKGTKTSESEIAGGSGKKMVVYRSSVPHRVVHSGGEVPARMLVIRFNIQCD